MYSIDFKPSDTTHNELSAVLTILLNQLHTDHRVIPSAINKDLEVIKDIEDLYHLRDYILDAVTEHIKDNNIKSPSSLILSTLKPIDTRFTLKGTSIEYLVLIRTAKDNKPVIIKTDQVMKPLMRIELYKPHLTT